MVGVRSSSNNNDNISSLMAAAVVAIVSLLLLSSFVGVASGDDETNATPSLEEYAALDPTALAERARGRAAGCGRHGASCTGVNPRTPSLSCSPDVRRRRVIGRRREDRRAKGEQSRFTRRWRGGGGIRGRGH